MSGIDAVKAVRDSLAKVLDKIAIPQIEEELSRPITVPSYVLEVRGCKTGVVRRVDGRFIHYNLGGRRIWPHQGFEDLVVHELT